MGVICGGAIVVGHTRIARLTVVDPRTKEGTTLMLPKCLLGEVN